MKYCIKCGAELEDAAKVCNKCGANCNDISDSDKLIKYDQDKKNRKAGIYNIISFLLNGGIAYSMLDFLFSLNHDTLSHYYLGDVLAAKNTSVDALKYVYENAASSMNYYDSLTPSQLRNSFADMKFVWIFAVLTLVIFLYGIFRKPIQEKFIKKGYGLIYIVAAIVANCAKILANVDFFEYPSGLLFGVAFYLVIIFQFIAGINYMHGAKKY